MRKTLPYLGAWFVAGLLAVTLASVGVSMVTEQVTTSNRPAALNAAELRDELASIDEEATAGTATTVPETPTAASVGEVPPGSSPSGSSPGGSGATTPTGASPGGGEAGPTGSTTTAPVPPATPAPVTRTYDLVGGTTTLRFTSGGVTVLTATPKPGFSVDLGSAHDGGARVEFQSDDHRSRVDAWWDGGPQDEVREES